MSQLPRIGLRPVASPVDTYAAPEVRMDSPDRTLAGLGEALQQFNPALAQFAQARQQVVNADAREAALADIAKIQAKNKEEFAQAQREGLIEKNDNPWYQRTWDEHLAKKGFEDATKVWAEEFRKDPNRRSTDLTGKDYEAFLRDRIKQYASGLDSVGLQAIAPIAEDFVSKSVAAQVGKRTQEADRVILAQASRDVSRISGELFARNNLTGPPDPNVPDNYAEQLQAALDNLDQSGALPSDVTATVIAQSIYEAAARAGTVEAVNDAEGVLGKLVVGTGASAKTVRSLVPEADFKKLRDKAKDETRRQLIESYQDSELQKKIRVDSALEQWRTTGAFDVSSLSIPEQLSFNQSLNQFRDSASLANEPEVVKMLSDYADKVAAGKASPTDRLGLELFVVRTLPAYKANDYLTMLARLGDDYKWPRDTDPELFITLFDRALKGENSPDFLAEIGTLAKEGKLSKGDFERFRNVAIREGGSASGLDGRGGVLQATAEYLGLRINSSSIDWVSTTFEDKNGNLVSRPTQAAEKLQYDITQKLLDRMAAYEKSPEGRGATREEARAYAEKFINDQLEIAGLEPVAEWSKRSPHREVLTAINEAVNNNPGRLLDRRFGDQLVFKDGQFKTKRGGVEVTSGFLLDVPKTLGADFSRWAAKLGAETDQDKRALFDSQVEAMKAAGYKREDISAFINSVRTVGSGKVVAEAEAKAKDVVKTAKELRPEISRMSVEDRDTIYENVIKATESLVELDPYRARDIARENMKMLWKTRRNLKAGDTFYVTDEASQIVYTADDTSALDAVQARYDRFAKVWEQSKEAIKQKDIQFMSSGSFWGWWTRELSKGGQYGGAEEANKIIEDNRLAAEKAAQDKKDAAAAALLKK